MNWLLKLFGRRIVLLFSEDGEITREWSYTRNGKRYVNWALSGVLILNDDWTVSGRNYFKRWEFL